MRFNKKICSLLLISLSFFLTTSHINGATKLIVQPSRFELLLSPGKTETQAVTIINKGDEPVRIGVGVRDWEMDEVGNPLFTLPKETDDSFANWFRFNPRVFLLLPGSKQVVRFSITTPSHICSGEHRAAILFAGEVMGSRANLSLANNILVTIYGYNRPVSREGSLDEVFVNYHKDNGLDIRCKIKSTGNSHLRLTGSFKVMDSDNTIQGEGLYQGSVIFPGRIRYLSGKLPIDLPPGEYKVESHFFFIPALYANNLFEYKTLDNSTGFKNITAFTVNAE